MSAREKLTVPGRNTSVEKEKDGQRNKRMVSM